MKNQCEHKNTKIWGPHLAGARKCLDCGWVKSPNRAYAGGALWFDEDAEDEAREKSHYLSLKEKYEGNTPESSMAEPKAILDGADMNQDIHQLIGYCVSLGWTEKVMPSQHCSALAEEFLEKYRKVGL